MALISVRTERAQWSQVIPTTLWVSMVLMAVPPVGLSLGWSRRAGGCRWCPAGVRTGEVAGPHRSCRGVLVLAGLSGLWSCLRGPQPRPGDDGANGGDGGGA